MDSDSDEQPHDGLASESQADDSARPPAWRAVPPSLDQVLNRGHWYWDVTAQCYRTETDPAIIAEESRSAAEHRDDQESMKLQMAQEDMEVCGDSASRPVIFTGLAALHLRQLFRDRLDVGSAAARLKDLALSTTFRRVAAEAEISAWETMRENCSGLEPVEHELPGCRDSLGGNPIMCVINPISLQRRFKYRRYIAQEFFERALDELGRLCSVIWHPHEDWAHKWGNLASSIRLQVDGVGCMLNRQVLRSVAAKAGFREITRVLDSRTDKQNKLEQALIFTDVKFREAVRKAGHEDIADVLSILGDVHALWDNKGLTPEVRNKSIWRYRRFFNALYGNTWNSHEKVPSHMMGVPTGILAALIKNIDSMETVQQSYGPNMFGKLRNYGSYRCEQIFSALVQLLGFKPAAELALKALRSITQACILRFDPYRPYFFPVSRHAHYDHSESALEVNTVVGSASTLEMACEAAQATLERVRKSILVGWNDGSRLLGLTSSSAGSKGASRKRMSEEPMSEQSVRSMFKMP